MLTWRQLCSPHSAEHLTFSPLSPGSLHGTLRTADALESWPVLCGIPFIKPSRRDLADRALEYLQSGQITDALAAVLRDVDDFAPERPSSDNAKKLAEQVLDSSSRLTSRGALSLLKLGPVADYFALRPIAPTFLSGLSLLRMTREAEQPVVEIACGAGHFLFWLNSWKRPFLGIDTVFSKLLLAHQFLGIPAENLLCCEVSAHSRLPVETLRPATVFCHDALYFIEGKASALAEFRRLSQPQGRRILGHCHLASAHHGIVSGFPISFSEYAAIAADGSTFFNDAELSVQEPAPKPLCETTGEEQLAGIEAVSWIEGQLTETESRIWPPGCDLCIHSSITWNPREEKIDAAWPSPSFASEYGALFAKQVADARNPHLTDTPINGRRGPSQIPHSPVFVPHQLANFGVKPLRWGIIGAGWIAQDYFAQAFSHVPHAELMAVADPNAHRVQAITQNCHAASYASWEAMLEKEAIDAIYLATPNHLHASIFADLAARGLSVLCEKPLVTNLADCDELERTTSGAPGRFQTAYDQRYHPAHERVADACARGALGQVTQVRVHYACWLPDNWQKVSDTENWRIDRAKAGGGAGFDLLPHCLDLLSHLLRDDITTAHLIYQNQTHRYAIETGIDDGAVLSFATRRGALGSIHVGYNCPEDQPRRQMEIIGTRGRVSACNTMGQDPGGSLSWQIDGEHWTETFPESARHGPFVRQLDRLSRLWLHDAPISFPFRRDLELCRRLIKLDVAARRAD